MASCKDWTENKGRSNQRKTSKSLEKYCSRSLRKLGENTSFKTKLKEMGGDSRLSQSNVYFDTFTLQLE